MNKIITIIALLAIATSSRAWFTHYSTFSTVKKSSISVSELKSIQWINRNATDGSYSGSEALSWRSPDYSIVVMQPTTGSRIPLYIPKSNNTGWFSDQPNIHELPAFLEVYTYNRRAQSCSFSICSGENSDQLIKSVKVKFYTSLSNPHPARIGTFDYVGDCRYEECEGTASFSCQTVTITPYLPTSEIPLYLRNDAAYPEAKEGCLVTDIEIEYLQIDNSGTIDRFFATAYAETALGMAQAAIFEGNANPVAAYYANFSPADINKDNNINSADVVSVYDYILNGSSEHNGHAFVDLGLPSGTLWATCNVGAATPECWGDLYAYGTSLPFTQTSGFCTSEDYNIPTSEPTMADWDDWFYPTTDEFDELRNNTSSSLATINGNVCAILTSDVNGKQIVFPLPGYAYDSGYNNNGTGYYWAAEPSNSNTSASVVEFIIGRTHNIDYLGITNSEMPKYQAASLRMTFKPQ